MNATIQSLPAMFDAAVAAADPALALRRHLSGELPAIEGQYILIAVGKAADHVMMYEGFGADPWRARVSAYATYFERRVLEPSRLNTDTCIRSRGITVRRQSIKDQRC